MAHSPRLSFFWTQQVCTSPPHLRIAVWHVLANATSGKKLWEPHCGFSSSLPFHDYGERVQMEPFFISSLSIYNETGTMINSHWTFNLEFSWHFVRLSSCDLGVACCLRITWTILNYILLTFILTLLMQTVHIVWLNHWTSIGKWIWIRVYCLDVVVLIITGNSSK